MKKIILIVLAVALIGLLIFRQSSQQTSIPGESIKIGVVYGFTGAASTWADMGKKGVDLAVKEVNANGGINGQPIEVIYEDSQTNPGKGVSAFTKLVVEDKVKIAFGDVWSFITNPLIPIAEQNKVVLISPTVMDASAEVASPYFYTLGHTIESQREALDAFFELNKEVRTMALMCWNDAWGQANRTLVLDIINKRNLKVVSDECLNDFGATYQSEITKIKAANPDAIYFNSSLPDVVLRKIKDLGLKNQKVLTLSPAVDAIEVNKTPVAYLQNVFFANWVPEQSFINKFEKEHGVYPIIEAQNHYDTLRAVAMALKAGGELRESLNKVKFKGVEGYPIDFSKGNQIRPNEGKAGLYIYDGEYKKVN